MRSQRQGKVQRSPTTQPQTWPLESSVNLRQAEPLAPVTHQSSSPNYLLAQPDKQFSLALLTMFSPVSLIQWRSKAHVVHVMLMPLTPFSKVLLQSREVPLELLGRLFPCRRSLTAPAIQRIMLRHSERTTETNLAAVVLSTLPGRFRKTGERWQKHLILTQVYYKIADELQGHPTFSFQGERSLASLEKQVVSMLLLGEWRQHHSRSDSIPFVMPTDITNLAS